MSGDTIRGRIGGLHLALAALNGVSAGELGNRTKSHRLTQLGGAPSDEPVKRGESLRPMPLFPRHVLRDIRLRPAVSETRPNPHRAASSLKTRGWFNWQLPERSYVEFRIWN
jgi:hypothetical protein